jgi:hypothetical protein
LDGADCRIKGAFALYDQSISTWDFYFTHSSRYTGSGWHSGMVNGKITWVGTTITATGNAYGGVGYDFLNCNIAFFGTGTSDRTILLSSNVASNTMYPGHIVVAADANSQYSLPVNLSTGSGYIDEYDQIKQINRYGDYSGICRKLTSPAPTVWVAGSFGTNFNNSGTWIGEISSSPTKVKDPSHEMYSKLYPNPAINHFNYEFDAPASGLYNIKLVSADGSYAKVIFSDYLGKGKANISMKTQGFKNGIYVLTVYHNSSTFKSEKIIVRN